MDPRAKSLVELHYRHAYNYGKYLFPYEEDSGSAAVEALHYIANDWVEKDRGEIFWPWASNALRWRLTDWWRVRYGRDPTNHKRNLIHERSLPDNIHQRANEEDVERIVLSNVFVEQMDTILVNILTEREVVLIRMRLQEKSLKEIGDLFGVTESRACQIWIGARKKIRGVLL